MTRRIIVPDACALVAALTDDDPVGSRAASAVRGARLATPHLMPYEAGNVLQRLEAGGELTAAAASRAHDRLLALPFDAHPYRIGAARARQLRANTTTHDAACIAVAELVAVSW